MAPDPSPKGDQRVAYGNVADGSQRNADATANLPPDLVAEARRCPGGWVYRSTQNSTDMALYLPCDPRSMEGRR